MKENPCRSLWKPGRTAGLGFLRYRVSRRLLFIGKSICLKDPFNKPQKAYGSSTLIRSYYKTWTLKGLWLMYPKKEFYYCTTSIYLKEPHEPWFIYPHKELRFMYPNKELYDYKKIYDPNC